MPIIPKYYTFEKEFQFISPTETRKVKIPVTRPKKITKPKEEITIAHVDPALLAKYAGVIDKTKGSILDKYTKIDENGTCLLDTIFTKRGMEKNEKLDEMLQDIKNHKDIAEEILTKKINGLSIFDRAKENDLLKVITFVKQNHKDLLDNFFSITNKFGFYITSTADKRYANKIVDCYERNPEGLKKIMELENPDGGTFIHYHSNAPEIISRIFGVIKDEKYAQELMLKQDNKGRNFIHETESVALFRDLKELKNKEFLNKILSQQDKDGNTPFFNAEDEKIKAIFDMFKDNIDDLLRILAIKNNKNEIALQYINTPTLEYLLNMLNGKKLDEFIKILKTETGDGIPFFINAGPQKTKLIVNFFINQKFYQKSLLTIKDKNGNNILHNAGLSTILEIFKYLGLQKNGNETIAKLLIHKNKDKKLPIHTIKEKPDSESKVKILVSKTNTICMQNKKNEFLDSKTIETLKKEYVL